MKVHNDDAAQVAQPQLPRDGLRSLQVGLENRVVKIARAHVAACVHIHGGQGLGLVHDQVATRLQFNTRRPSALATSSSIEYRSKIGRSPL